MATRTDAPPSIDRRIGRARAFYGIAGLLAVLASFMAFWAPFQGWLSGCSIHTTQAEMEAVWDSDVAVVAASTCAYYLDIPGVVVPLVVGSVLVIGAWRYFRPDSFSTVATALAIPAGVLVGAVPAYTVWWLIDYYRLSIGPTELVLIVLAGAILAWALVAGWRTASYLRHRSPSVASA